MEYYSAHTSMCVWKGGVYVYEKSVCVENDFLHALHIEW